MDVNNDGQFSSWRKKDLLVGETWEPRVFYVKHILKYQDDMTNLLEMISKSFLESII